MNIYTTVTSKTRHSISFGFVVLSVFILSSITYAKITQIPSKSVLLAKKKMYNKNIRFYWNSQKKHIEIKRKNKTIQYINFGVNPSIVEIIDVNFDGYGDISVKIPENILGEYDESGVHEHMFYYLYDRKTKKFIYHKKLTNVIYEADVYGMQIRGYAFDAKKKVLHTFDMKNFYYGGNVYVFKNKSLVLTSKGLRLVPSYYPDGVDVKYRYKKGKVTQIQVLQDGNIKTRKKINITMTDKIYTSAEVNLTNKKQMLEQLLLKNIYHAFTNHKFQIFAEKHFYYKESRTKETSLLDITLMLDSVFKTDGKRKKDDTIFELLTTYADVKDIDIEGLVFDEKKSMYSLDVALQLTNRVQRYRWYFYIDKYENYIYFLPFSYDNKNQIYTMLNDNYTFDNFETQGMRLSNIGKELGISTPWVHSGQEQWHQSYEKCWSKYIEFGLSDYTGNGHIDWFNTCTSSLVKRKESKHVIRFGGKYQFHTMLQPFTASKYFWNKKKNRFVFTSTWNGGSYQVCEQYLNDKKEKSIKCEKYYTDYQVKDYFKVGNKYISNKLFEDSIKKDDLYLEDSRRKVKRDTLVYLYMKDIEKHKPYASLKEDTLVMPSRNTVPYWDINISSAKPLSIGGVKYYKRRKYYNSMVLPEKDTIPWNPKLSNEAPTNVYAIVYYKGVKYYMDAKNYK